jgi:preprotein translocase subunit YajC
MESPKARILLLFVCMLLGLAFFFMARHERAKAKMSEQMKTGIKVFSDPESLIKE